MTPDADSARVRTAEENPLGTEPIGKLLCRFAFPSCISLIVNALYNIVDQIFIGRGVGYLGNGATNVILPVTVLAIGIGMLFGDGCSAFMSMQLGKKDEEAASAGAANTILCLIASSILLCILTSLFLRPICMLCGATETILPYAMEYGRIIFLGLPFSMFTGGMSSIIRADGSPSYSMAGLLSGCLTNIVLDYIFVFPLDMGIAGAALATVIGQAVNVLIFIGYFARFRHVRLTKSRWRMRPSFVGRICQLGASSFILQMTVVVIMIVNNKLLVYWGALSKYGADIPLTALGVTMKVNNILIAIMNGIGAGALPIIGYNYGAGNMDRVKQTIKLSVGTAMFCGVIATVCFQLFPGAIVSIFGTESELYMEFGILCLRIFLLLCVLDGLNYVLPTCFQAIGRPMYSVAASLIRQIIILIPAAVILPFFIGVTGVLWAGPVAQGGAFIVNLFLLRTVLKQQNSSSCA